MDGGRAQTFCQRMRRYLKQRKHLFSVVEQGFLKVCVSCNSVYDTKVSVKKHTQPSSWL